MTIQHPYIGSGMDLKRPGAPVSVKALWMHQMAKRGIKLTYMPTAEMAADRLTKGLGASRLPQIRDDLTSA